MIEQPLRRDGQQSVCSKRAAPKSLLIYSEGRSGLPRLHAVNKATGEELVTIDIPSNTQTAPMTFMHEGKQYLCMAIAGRGADPELIALTLPEE
jgi:quinoprotein glucose dehydrogenase